ncbi:MAG: hypothetical protein CRN43_11340 [Candidatus Nephrothrix sp. EaCA]|nr:MAG: hypothetical protein CRN43_11340 [Candidatus Nephrothrix sp. EaCA]
MKASLCIFIVNLCLPSFDAGSQHIFGPIKEAISVGNAKNVAQYFDNSLDIAFDSEEKTCPKETAGLLLRDFFKKNEPSGFVILHNGAASKGGGQYAIGNYTSADKTKYTVLIRVRQTGNRFLIHELSFVKE